jgi:hypothetical protein
MDIFLACAEFSPEWESPEWIELINALLDLAYES